MNTYRSRPFLGFTFFVAVLLFVLPDRSYAFSHLWLYYNAGTVPPSSTQLCAPRVDNFANFESGSYTNEGAWSNLNTSSGPSSEMCVTLPAGTTLTGNFDIDYTPSPGENTIVFYGTVAGPNVAAQPKYGIVGVFYAPPCTSGKVASSAVYGSADQIKVDNSLTSEYTQSDSVTLSGSVSFEADFVPITIGGSTSYGWSDSTISGNDVAVTTSDSENYTFDGCTQGLDGVNHSYDSIWIWLDPMVPYYVPPSTSPVQQILVFGFGSDGRDPVTSQTRQPDVVILSVLQIQSLIGVLNTNQTPTPANTGIDESTLQALQRTWDTTWATNSGAEPGPGLVAADYEDILKADPFVANPSFNPESSTRYALVDGIVHYDATSTPQEFQYVAQSTNTTAQTNGTDDQHYVSVEVSVQAGSGITPGQAKLDYAGKWLWDTKSQSTTTNTSTQTATYNIWTPVAATYTGSDQLAVYWDTVYQSFAFYPVPQ